MRHTLLTIISALLLSGTAFASRLSPASGRVVSEQGEAIAFATVVLLQDGCQAAGTATGSDGCFSLRISSGDYKLSVQCLGYEPLEQVVSILPDTDLGDFTLRTASNEIEGVVVKARLVRREADRFVVDVANSPAAIGRSGTELLKNAPGVWIQDDKISVNGKPGTKVYVNDRQLRMDDAQLAAYLRGLTAAGIRKIEVIPTTGADYDADNAGGVIRITLKRQRDDGITGNIQFGTHQGRYVESYNPSGSISYHSGRWSLTGDVWGTWEPKAVISTEEHTRYFASDKTLGARSEAKGWNNDGGGRIGIVCDVNDRHSLGVEAEYWVDNESMPIVTETVLAEQKSEIRNASRYGQLTNADRVSATFNYVWKIDTLGSVFKVLADYDTNRTDGRKTYFTRSVAGSEQRDSTYRNSTLADYRALTANAALEKIFSPKITLKAGVKHTFNDMKNTSLYEYEQGEWQTLGEFSFDLNYREHISALYAAFTAHAGRWSFVAGLRGEYTCTSGGSSYVRQNYVSLFPNANVSFALTKDGSCTLSAQYARNITRPSFWALNPQRVQISDYTYQIGNPALRPSFSHNADLTLVVAQKYALTLSAVVKKDDINQTFLFDPDEPDVVYFRTENFADTQTYTASAYLPFQPAKWWSLNASLLYSRYGERLTADRPQQFHSMYRLGGSTTFTLPARFYLDIDYYYNSRIVLTDTRISSQHRLDIGVKKRFSDDRFTVGISFQNVLDSHQIYHAVGDRFTRRISIYQTWDSFQVRLRFAYNFKAGKAFRKRSVETGAATEKGRM